ncbi:hypothetical protein GCM10009092_18740 [Bowmanella denitrificans]|uniref:DUF3857 domain-containing protein n=1 Tax=Bowmanella denitrificans TaxID=366582 RepID=A0ABP3GVJ7_9ALTE
MNNFNGIAHLLVDRQWKIQETQQSRFEHFAEQALNAEGLGYISNIEIDFDPSYEQVILHDVEVIRSGVSEPRLPRARISLLQLETQREYQIYNGRKTLSLVLDDIRVGDVVHYSYSVVGVNPVYAGHFSNQLALGWRVPAALVNYRLVWQENKPLYIQNHLTDIEPNIETHNGTSVYHWQQAMLEEIEWEDNIPGWYDPFPFVQVSDYASWQDVVAWAIPLFQSRPQEMATVIDEIRSTHHSVEEQLLSALRFSQESIRYLGIEMGIHSHQPHSPAQVLLQRYGDCKDKALLLVSILNGLGIEANVALVNTQSGLALPDSLPTPLRFNHAIVRAKLHNQTYWLDATRTYQSGNLAHLYQADFDYALVIAKDTANLQNMSADILQVHRKKVVEYVDLRTSHDEATYEVTTSYDGFYADQFREQLAGSNLKTMQQNYLEYTQKYFENAKVSADLTVYDDDGLNRITVTENYVVSPIWQAEAGSDFVSVNFEPFLMDDHLHKVEKKARRYPMSFSHPVEFTHITRIKMPADSNFADEQVSIKDQAFDYSKVVQFDGETLELTYSYGSKKSVIEPEYYSDYAKNIGAAQEEGFYLIQKVDPALNFGTYQFAMKDINWPVILLLLVSLLVCVWLSIKVIRYDPPVKPYQPEVFCSSGIGGWLILPMLGLLITPLALVIQSRDLWYLASAKQWAVISQHYDFPMMTLLCVELFTNVMLLVGTITVLWLFFKRRQTLPKVYVIYKVAMLLIIGIDLYLTSVLGGPDFAVEAAEITEWLSMLVTSLIWISYFLVSKRVKATFIRRYNSAQTEASTPEVAAEGAN